MTDRIFHITGRVMDHQTGRGFAGLRVEAWDKDRIYDDRVSSAVTDAQGAFHMAVEASTLQRMFSGDRWPDLYFRVYQGDRLITSTEDSVLWNATAPTTPIVIEVDRPSVEPPKPTPIPKIKREFVGRLLDKDSSRPLARYVVHAFDLEAGPEPADLGYDLADSQGRFIVKVLVSGEPSQPRTRRKVFRRRLRLHILDRQRREVYQEEIQATTAQAMTLHVPLPVAPPPKSPTLKQVEQRLKLSVPTDLLDHLAQRRPPIGTLADLRRAGGLKRLAGLPVDPSDEAAQALDALAGLDALTSDLRLSGALVRNGFRSLTAIARARRADVVRALKKDVGHFKAAQVHAAARAQARFLDNLLTGLRADHANGFPSRMPDLTNSPIPQWFRRKCDCRDCEAATSPLMYLADLLDYTLQHLRYLEPGEEDSEPVDVAFLIERFHQPFETLSLTCEALDARVRQVRLCVEVLRGYWRRDAVLPEDQQLAYCLAAYDELLARIGTSSAELRLASSEPEDEPEDRRQALAERLGLDLGETRPDPLDDLLLDPDEAPDAAHELNEGNLERLFGLVDTTRNPLAPADEPLFLTWRMDHLRRLWRDQDHPADPYLREPQSPFESEDLLPIVDPDIVGPDDLRHPSPGQATFDLWLVRRNWVDAQLEVLAAFVPGDGTPDLAAAFDHMRQPVHYQGPDGNDHTETPWSDATGPDDFAALLTTLNQSSTEAVRETRERILRDLRLTPEAFAHLATIHARDQAWQDGAPVEPVSEDEWLQVRSILTQAKKVAFFEVWRVEEHAAGILLGRKDLWISLREPHEGNWPPVSADPPRPWIDPDIVSRDGLPEPPVGDSAIEIWGVRHNEIQNNRERLRRARQADGLSFDQLVAQELGCTRDELTELRDRLESGLADEVEGATTTITTELDLSVELFNRLMALRTREDNAQPSRRLSSIEWEEVYAILTQAWKVRDRFEDWHGEEQDIAYWRALKARLPRWRASVDGRRQWQEALGRRSRPPIIDPDLLLDTSHLQDAHHGPAARQWRERSDWVLERLGEIDRRRQQEGSLIDGFNAIVESSLQVPANRLTELESQYSEGEDIRAQLAQLDLPFGAFRRLLRVRALAENGNVRESEWQEVYSILIQVEKQRLFADWRQAERDEGVVLSPDHFELPVPPEPQILPVEPAPLPAWRASLQMLRDWEQTLRSRLEQQQAIADALRTVVSGVEETTLPMLRDLLIDNIVVGNTMLENKAKQLSDRLMIDMRAGGCQVTTRVAQAIETLQGLLWATRAGLFVGDAFELALAAPSFDEEWKWLGSYATWRAAMLVYVYPENVLLPTLRKRQTPGFERLVQELRDARELTPEDACLAARRYYCYFQDICHLEPKASRRAVTRLPANLRCGEQQGHLYALLLHLFAQPKAGKSIYWSTYSDWPLEHDQSFWDAVPGLEGGGEIMGTAEYWITRHTADPGDLEERFLYLFVRTGPPGGQKLLYTRYDLENRFWQTKPEELQLPQDVETFEAQVVKQPEVVQPPVLRIKAGNTIYERQLDRTGTTWSADEWQAKDRLWAKWEPLPESDDFTISDENVVTAVKLGDVVHLFLVGEGEVYTATSAEDLRPWDRWDRVGDVGNVQFPANTVITAVARDNQRIDLFGVKGGRVCWNSWTDGGAGTDWTELNDEVDQILIDHPFVVPDGNVTAAVWLDSNQLFVCVVGDVHVQLPGQQQVLVTTEEEWQDSWESAGIQKGTEVLAFIHTNHEVAMLMKNSRNDVKLNIWDVEDRLNIGELGLQRRIWQYGVQDTDDLFSENAILSAVPQHYRLDLFMVSEEGIVETAFAEGLDPDAWHGWTGISAAEEIVFEQGSAVAAILMQNLPHNHLNLFAMDSKGKVYGTWSQVQQGERVWQPWAGIDIDSDPTFSTQTRIAALAEGKSIHLFVVGDDGKIYHNVSRRLPEANLIADGYPEHYHRPEWTGPYSVVAPQSEASLQNLRELSKNAYDSFLDNGNETVTNRIYLEEAFYFVPLHLALQLQRAGQYVAALDWYRTVYDYSIDEKLRKISFVLACEELEEEMVLSRTTDWLLDPLNPHAIAITRPGAYIRFTMMALVRCLLEYGDAEFTKDTAESVQRARVLYTRALELLGLPELRWALGNCEDAIAEAEAEIGGLVDDDRYRPELEKLLERIRELEYLKDRIRVILEAEGFLGARDEMGEALLPLEERLVPAGQAVDEALAWQVQDRTLGTVVAGKPAALDKAYQALVAYDSIAEAASAAAIGVGQDFLHAISLVTGIERTVLVADESIELPEMEETMGHFGPDGGAGFAQGAGDGRPVWEPYENAIRYDPHALTPWAILAHVIRGNPLAMLPPLLQFPDHYRPELIDEFCIPPNPVLEAMRLHAELNLRKIRTCRNIAGMARPLAPYAATTDTTSGLPIIGPGGQLILPGVRSIQPTQYRFAVLIERAKELVQMASQMEAAMLSALEKRDAEAYTALKARQDVDLAWAGVRLQGLRVDEAKIGIALAELQRERALIQKEHYQELLRDPINEKEEASLALMQTSTIWQGVAAAHHMGSAANVLQAIVTFGSGILQGVAEGFGALAGAASTQANMLSTWASYDRRAQEWELGRDLARQDARLGSQQIRLAQAQEDVAKQEHTIARRQADHAGATAEFLANKFTNVELYDWMSGVLRDVYSFFLQQATSVARLAEYQLAFERQETPPACIQADYWEAPIEGVQSTGGQAPDRRGLTGSARLLQDLYRLDQYAVETEKRKLQLSKTISLARLDPFAFQRFRETGVMRFSTPLEMFDRDFPGHYLRLIKRVRASIVALIPPTEGIHATLTSSGISRVVIGGDLFQTVAVRRAPESVALTSPRDATGLFELQAQPEMLLPFEGMGVDLAWEFRMPRAANQFDYSTMADVLLTLEYTALDSYDYRVRVVRDLGYRVSADRSFSFRHELADQWYDLHNPDLTTTPMIVRFETRREDFASNLEQLVIEQVLLYFSLGAEDSIEAPVISLRFREQGAVTEVGGEAAWVGGVISTRRGNAGSWTSMIGRSPFGVWELALPDSFEIRELFANEEVEDILFVITYSGRTPEWPA